MWYVYIIRSINFPDQEYVGANGRAERRSHPSSEQSATLGDPPPFLI
jgi:hypothetical protein